MIINEQSKPSREDLLKDNWVDAKPKDYNGKDYFPSKLGADGIRYYKRRDGKPIGQSEVVSFEGTYTVTTPIPKIDKLKIHIYKSNKEDSLFLRSLNLDKIPALKDYAISQLIPNKDNKKIFSITNQSGDELVDAITFDNDNNGFTFNYSVAGSPIKIKAKKEATSDSNNVTPPTPEKTKTDTKKDTKTSVSTDSKIPQLKKTTVTFEKTPEDKTPTKPCSDFPFELGCVNPKIGDFNAATFRGNRFNDTYTTTVQTFLDRHRWFTKDNPNKKLTLDIWNEFMNKSVIKESIKKVLKEYINKKK